MEILKNSKRCFNIYVVDSKGNIIHLKKVSLFEILNEQAGLEVFYTLQEQLDDLLDIPERCTLAFKLRDDQFSHGLITRIS